MRDFATSDDPAVQSQLDRLAQLSLPQGRFGLETITALCARLGNPQRRLPPVFHVAGTNGKGSTCAFLRAMLEAAGKRVHVYTSPHLVRFNERIRIAGTLIDDALLAALLAEVLDAGEDLHPSFFEVTTAAAFLALARTSADACVIEVGLGGRFDATNVIPAPAVCGIASLGIDHEAFLLAPEENVPEVPIARIAFEKAGIAKPGVPLVTFDYDELANLAVAATAQRAGGTVSRMGREWSATVAHDGITYVDEGGALMLPLPSLPGVHQADNAALAVAMLRHQNAVSVPEEAFAKGIFGSRWPARLQLLGQGPLTDLTPNRRVWLDGGHNPDAGRAIAEFFGADVARKLRQAQPERVLIGSHSEEAAQSKLVKGHAPTLHLILGMLANKDPTAIIAPLQQHIASLTVVPIPGHDAHPASAFPDALAAPDIPAALAAISKDGRDVLIAGSLYLAGEVLRLNRELPC